jgi:cytochrome c-type biogenesis protein CcmH/NrfG
MRAKATVALLVAVLVFYAVVIGRKGVDLVAVGTPTAVALGVALLVLPAVGLLLVWREVEFGRRTARLGARLANEGGLSRDDLPRRPSGRVDRAAADAAFAGLREEVRADPESWRVWYRLALAYDAAGDRGRAREAARHAVALSRAEGETMAP